MTPDLSIREQLERALAARACAKAWAHIATKTLAGASPDEIRACIRSAEVRRLEERLQDVGLTGDLLAVQTILQTINRAYKTALSEVRQGRVA